jgi:dTDP-4-amino-4,6-dideoxy-D-galactose acyltransferase
VTRAAQRSLAAYGHQRIIDQNPEVSAENACCQYLDWDSNFFGYRIARVAANRLDGRSAKEILKWCAACKIDCLYFLADADDDTTVLLAERHKFHLVDIRTTFERRLDRTPPQLNKDCRVQVRVHAATDIPALREIARSSYHHTRFYYDRHFPPHLADSLYETWIEKSCSGYAETVLVADVEGEPVGYISCQLPEKSTGQIGLVGLSREWNGLGLAQMLVNESLRWFAARGVEHVRVVTQGRNCKAQRLYERSGFVTEALHLWYHRWFL